MPAFRFLLMGAWALQAIYLIFCVPMDSAASTFIVAVEIMIAILGVCCFRAKAPTIGSKPLQWCSEPTEWDVELWQNIKRKEFLFRRASAVGSMQSANAEDFRIFLAISKARDLAAYPAREAADLNFGKVLTDSEWSAIEENWNRIWSLWTDAENEFQRQDAWLLGQRAVFSAAVESLGPEWDDVLRETKNR